MTPHDDLATLRELCDLSETARYYRYTAALSRVETELERLEARVRTRAHYVERAEAAEAEATRLQEGLRRIVGESYNLVTQGELPTQRRQPSAQAIYDIARSLLADNQEPT